jgi:hypothetical protein
LAAYVGVDVLYGWWLKKQRVSELRSAFAQGTVPEPNVRTGDLLIERRDVSKKIESIIQPPAIYDSYNMIVGDHGSGKTTLVCMVGHKKSGIIYVDVPPTEPFEKAFAKALKWSPEIKTPLKRFAEKYFSYTVPKGSKVPWMSHQ